eukprot:CAMPEP_0181464928 /NCGR_PEP_ID=MMETSP1110-20121109/35688_1 /TAXON_ID=174948 /ORGANISM="Symbiodinium sp., Strain CCMP421" /LENGTH=97 /DNA_ID=CAMNT_0023589683 /DNA_START=87 /DNA_END=380 /DNA_ORIENTATION=-
MASAFGAVKFKLSEADRLNRKGEAREARSLYLEARRAAEASSQALQAAALPGAERMECFAARMQRGQNESRSGLQAAIEAALLQAEEASAPAGSPGR